MKTPSHRVKIQRCFTDAGSGRQEWWFYRGKWRRKLIAVDDHLRFADGTFVSHLEELVFGYEFI